MSQLSDKITSYTHEFGVEFNQAYTLNPTFTGTNAPSTTAYFQLTNAAPVYESSVGPIGGAGSWKFSYTNGSAGTYFRSRTATVISTWADGDYSEGFWFKFNTLPTGTGTHPFKSLLPTSVAPGYTLTINGSSHATNPSKLAQNFGAGAISETIVVDQWYYIAFRKTTTASTAQIYLNGALVATGSNTNTGSNNVVGWGGSTTAAATYSFNISNWYMGTNAQFTSTEIAEIWTAGSTAPVTNNLKYWNGTAWTVPINKYQWDGTNWVTMNGKYWNGTSWIAIT